MAVIFFSRHHLPTVEELLSPIISTLDGCSLIGCTSDTIIGDTREVEEGPAVSLWLADLGTIALQPFHMHLEDTPDGQAIVGFPLIASGMEAAILMADPFTFPTQVFLSSINQDHPGLPVIGGMASGASRAGDNLLVFNNEVRTYGAVGALIGIGAGVTPLVSQGCKPIGDTFTITGAHGNVIFELGGKPPVERLRQTLSQLSPDDAALVHHGINIGIVIDEKETELLPGDFLVRAVMHANTESGHMVIGDNVQVGQSVQFQLRDADSAGSELDFLIEAYADSSASDVKGALIFSCNGRGTGMFSIPNHDVTTLDAVLGPLPTAGMFCAGEIGPIGSRNYVHGFTASIALFTQR
ncbi:MAG: FIST N-terminal domain-containing protein [Actinomycetota bacterium]|nr:FIST C-terminal domain-containing protein [Actinomycetota bacterium]